MALEIQPMKFEQVDRLADICYRAFKDISERHGFKADFAVPEVPRLVLGLLAADEDVHSAVAMEAGEPVGSNFLSTHDEVGAVGPITVEPLIQGGGIGRRLMEDVLEFARDNGIEKVRLVQDSFNMRSLALYASLGFDTKAPLAVMEPPGATIISPRVRRSTQADLDAIEGLSRSIYRVSRRREAEVIGAGPFAAFVYDDGRVRGYFLAGIAGHGVAESEDIMVELVLAAMGEAPPPAQVFFCPLIEGSLYRRFLATGCRNRKVMNLMALGPYEEPQGVWLPSVGY